MKICHVTSAHNRYDGRIFKKQLTSLAKKYDTYLLCCDNLENEEKNNVKIISTNAKFKNRYERFLKAKNQLKKKCIEIDADIYQFHDMDLLDLALYMKKKGKKVIFDAHEDYEVLFLEREWIPNYLRKILLFFFIKKEKRTYPKFDYIICAADHIKDKLKKYNKNIEVIENFPILKDKIKKDNNLENIICFAGSIRRDWNHETVVKAIKDIPNITYKIAGTYTENYYNELAKNEGFDKVKLLGRLNANSVDELYSNSKIGMALCSYLRNTNRNIGSLGITKIFEYMANELPVIFTDFVLYKNINKEKEFGIPVNPYDIEEVKKAIIYLLENPKIAKKMGENGRYLIETKYNWNILEKKLFKVYEKIK